LAFGFWLLAFGFWLLAFGFWLLAFGQRLFGYASGQSGANMPGLLFWEVAES
jgi:hypothetical protein